MKKIVTDKDRIKQLESEIVELQDILESYRLEKETDGRIIDECVEYEMELEAEIGNLHNLIKNNTVVMALLADMSIHCSHQTYVGRAFKAAIKAYQTTLAEQLINIETVDDDEDLVPFTLDEIMGTTDKKEE